MKSLANTSWIIKMRQNILFVFQPVFRFHYGCRMMMTTMMSGGFPLLLPQQWMSRHVMEKKKTHKHSSHSWNRNRFSFYSFMHYYWILQLLKYMYSTESYKRSKKTRRSLCVNESCSFHRFEERCFIFCLSARHLHSWNEIGEKKKTQKLELWATFDGTNFFLLLFKLKRKWNIVQSHFSTCTTAVQCIKRQMEDDKMKGKDEQN